jgi:rod shape-determining protein MreD
MSRGLITLLLIAGALLQTLLKPLGIFGAMEFPVLTGLVICIALNTGRPKMVCAAVLAGLLHDAFCPAPLGLSIPFFILLAIGVNWIREEVFGDLPATYMLLGAAASVFETLYYALVFSVSGLRPVSPGLLGIRLIGGLLTAAVVVPLISLPVLRLRSLVLSNRRRFI